LMRKPTPQAPPVDPVIPYGIAPSESTPHASTRSPDDPRS
jgi:hypothetical protein